MGYYTLTAAVYVRQRSPEVYAALKSWGILDNITGEKRVTVSLDKATALHEDYLSLAEHEHSVGDKDRTAAIKEQRQKDFGNISWTNDAVEHCESKQQHSLCESTPCSTHTALLPLCVSLP